MQFWNSIIAVSTTIKLYHISNQIELLLSIYCGNFCICRKFSLSKPYSTFLLDKEELLADKLSRIWNRGLLNECNIVSSVLLHTHIHADKSISPSKRSQEPLLRVMAVARSEEKYTFLQMETFHFAFYGFYSSLEN